MSAAAPFATGSVSCGLHPLAGNAVEQAEMLVAQAQAAERAGFDGVTLSEHHGGFPGYMGQPLLASTWILAATARIWSGPAPYLLGVRSPLLVAEELGWTAARFPGRFAAALAPGYARSDYELLGASFEDRAERFAAALATIGGTLFAGSGDAALADDPAVGGWAASRAPLLSAANSTVAVERAASLGLGILFPGGEPRDRLARLIARYREAGGPGPVVKIRTLWMGTPPPGALEERDRIYRAAATAAGIRQTNGFAEPFVHGPGARILAEVAEDFEALDIDGVNARFYLPGIEHAAVLEQLEHFGSAVLEQLPSRQPITHSIGGTDGP
jgi:alkanesulfonate monooxygenase SsuD/methylene tetrahydromethanopterin reductase-like flavin-dependent oxidoreductase (luciferase family)